MNLFFLSLDLEKCASYHFDKHVIKMILEATQLLSTAHHVLAPRKASELLKSKMIYRATHVNHPTAVWVRTHINNYMFTISYALALCDEYRFRYGSHKVHKCESMIAFLKNNPPKSIPTTSETKLISKHLITEPPQCMPEQYRVPGKVVSAYRSYYKSPMKAHLTSWKNRPVPAFFS